jgi:hypothetical protein
LSTGKSEARGVLDVSTIKGIKPPITLVQRPTPVHYFISDLLDIFKFSFCAFFTVGLYASMSQKHHLPFHAASDFIMKPE